MRRPALATLAPGLTLWLAAGTAPAAWAQGGYHSAPPAAPPAGAADEPPPLPPEPPGSLPVTPTQPNKAIDRYQDCLQRMIDAGANDNLYMRRCLGYPDRPVPKRPSEAEALGKDVGDVAQRHLPALKDCYDKLLARGRELGFAPEGAVDAHFDLAASGGIEALTFEPGSLADVGLLSCFRERIKAWTVPRPRDGGGGKATVHLSFRLARAKAGKGGSVTVAKGFPKVSGSGSGGGGGGGGATGIAPEIVAAVFMHNVAGVRGCYDEVLRHRPSASGNATVELTVLPDGHVGKVAFRTLTIADDWFKGCVVAQLKSWRYPKPAGGEAAVVRYPPLVFTPAPPPGSAPQVAVPPPR